MNYASTIFLCPLMLVVNVDDAISTKSISSVKSTGEIQKCSALQGQSRNWEERECPPLDAVSRTGEDATD
jgi:hypothetical protein